MGQGLGTGKLSLNAVLIAAWGPLPSPVSLFNDRTQLLDISGPGLGASGLFPVDSPLWLVVSLLN